MGLLILLGLAGLLILVAALQSLKETIQNMASKDDLAAAVATISADITALQGRVGDVVPAADAQAAVSALNAADAVVKSIAAA